jgi:hypothetical protein
MHYQSTYAELATAVLTIETSRLKEVATDFAHNEETAHLTRVPASPTKAICKALTTTHLKTLSHNTFPQLPAGMPYQHKDL